MRKLLLSLVACAAALALAPHAARAAQCGLPDGKPLWIDYAEGTVSFRKAVFGQPGVVTATSGLLVPPDLRKGGAQTVYWEMRLGDYVGTTTAPADPSTIEKAAARLITKAAASSGCPTPLIALNELHGAGTTTPWTPGNGQYRANILALLRALAGRGARPFLLLAGDPYTGGEAADWWRAVAEVADLVPEVYFNAKIVYRDGPLLASRRLRLYFRREVGALTGLGIPPDRIGIMLGFQSGPGVGGRQGLQPSRAWLEIVKLQTLAARQVASELGLSTVWSWGWGTLSVAGADPDKPAAACVYLWVRDPRLCDGPSTAGDGFNVSLTEGQIALPAGADCAVGDQTIDESAVAALAAVTGDRDVAFTILLERVAEQGQVDVSPDEVLAAERAVIKLRFRGSRTLYVAALARAQATLDVARGAIEDIIRRARITASLKAGNPGAAEVAAFYRSYPSTSIRLVEASPAPGWLGGQPQGLAVAATAPVQVFTLPTGRTAAVQTADGVFQVRAIGEPVALGSLPLTAVRGAIEATLARFARADAFESWTVGRQTTVLRSAICLGDNLPVPGAVELTSYLPFLRLGRISTQLAS